MGRRSRPRLQCVLSTEPHLIVSAADDADLGFACCSMFDTVARLLDPPVIRSAAEIEAVKRGCMLAFGHAMTIAEGASANGAKFAGQGLLALGQRIGIALEEHRFWKDRELGVRKYDECALPTCSVKVDLKACSRCRTAACASNLVTATLSAQTALSTIRRSAAELLGLLALTSSETGSSGTRRAAFGSSRTSSRYVTRWAGPH